MPVEIVQGEKVKVTIDELILNIHVFKLQFCYSGTF